MGLQARPVSELETSLCGGCVGVCGSSVELGMGLRIVRQADDGLGFRSRSPDSAG